MSGVFFASSRWIRPVGILRRERTSGTMEAGGQFIIMSGRGTDGLRPEPAFRRGDVDQDGVLGIADPLNNLAFQFVGTYDPPCLDACDFDDNGILDIADPINNLSHQFLGALPPPPPGKDSCGPDPTPDDLGCESCCGETFGE